MELFTIIATAMITFNPRTSHDFWLLGKNSVLMINSEQRDMTAPSSTKWASCNGGTLASMLNETGKWKGFIMKKMPGFSFIAAMKPHQLSVDCLKSKSRSLHTVTERQKIEWIKVEEHISAFFLLSTPNNVSMDSVSIQDKVKIASDFLLSSPPGEVNDVFNGNVLQDSRQHARVLRHGHRCAYLGR